MHELCTKTTKIEGSQRPRPTKKVSLLEDFSQTIFKCFFMIRNEDIDIGCDSTPNGCDKDIVEATPRFQWTLWKWSSKRVFGFHKDRNDMRQWDFAKGSLVFFNLPNHERGDIVPIFIFYVFFDSGKGKLESKRKTKRPN